MDKRRKTISEKTPEEIALTNEKKSKNGLIARRENSKRTIFVYNTDMILIVSFRLISDCARWMVENGLANTFDGARWSVKNFADKNKIYNGIFYFKISPATTEYENAEQICEATV